MFEMRVRGRDLSLAFTLLRRRYFRNGRQRRWGGARGGGHAVCSYLDHAAVDGQGGADHVHVGRGGGALPLGQAAGRSCARRGVVEGVRGGIPVGGAAREGEGESERGREVEGEIILKS